MAIRPGVKKRCKHCGGWLEARLIQSARLEWDDLRTVVFAHTLPVLTCPKCDTAPQDRKATLWCPTA